MENNDLWNRITTRLFKKVDVPPPSEFFVQRVMARLGEAQEPAWKTWLIPSFGLGFAAVVFIGAFSVMRNNVSTETLLTAGNSAESETQWVFSDKAPNDLPPVEALQ